VVNTYGDIARSKTARYGTVARSVAVLVAMIGLGMTIAGCGGGSSGGPGAGGPTNPTGPTGQSQPGTAVFHVNVATGQVTVTPVGGQSAGAIRSHAIFNGTAVGFNSSVLLDQPGSDTGFKTLNVSITNNWGLPIGVTQDDVTTGLRVVFSSFTNLSTPVDISPLSTVSTAAGSAASGTADGSISLATFNGPAGAATGTNGALFITDYNAGNVRKISGGAVSTLAKGFVHPYGCSVNPIDGAVIVADYGANKIYRVASTGQVSILAGTGTAGGANGLGNAATFNAPTGVAIDSTGSIYISDYVGNRLRKITFVGGVPTDPANYSVATFSGTGAAGATDGSAGTATFHNPAGLALDSNGILYVADLASQKIRRVDPAGNVSTIAGTGVAAETDGRGDAAAFNAPRGITIVNNALVVSDSSGNRIRQVTLSGNSTASPTSSSSWLVQTLAGTGVAGSADGTGDVASFSSPLLIAADRSGNVYVPDYLNHRVRKIVPTNGLFPVGVPSGTTSTNAVVLSNPTGAIPSTGSNLPYIAYAGSLAAGATSAAQPWNFVIPSDVTDFQFTVTVETSTTTVTGPTSGTGKGSPNVQVRTLAGRAGSFGFVDGVATASRFGSFVQGLATDQAGNTYIADFHDNAIRRITPAGTVTTIAGTLATGGGSAIDGPGSIARFNGPSAVAVSADGQTIYIGDANNNKLRRIVQVANTDPTNPANWIVSTIAGSGTQSAADGPGNTASLVLPEGVAVDPTGNIYVSEDAGNRIKRVTFQGGDPTLSTNYQVRTVAGDISTTFPATGWVDATGTAARFADPVEIACDIQGNVYIADSFNNRIRKMDAGGVVTTVAGSTLGYADATGSSAQFNEPNGLAIDSAGYLYVADTSNLLIRRISPAGVVTTIAGTGASGSNDGTGDVATFTSPFGLTVNRTGDVIVGGTDGAIRLIQRVVNTGTQ